MSEPRADRVPAGTGGQATSVGMASGRKSERPGFTCPRRAPGPGRPWSAVEQDHPCPYWHPMSWANRRWSSSSMPSATMLIPNAWPKSHSMRASDSARVVDRRVQEGPIEFDQVQRQGAQTRQ